MSMNVKEIALMLSIEGTMMEESLGDLPFVDMCREDDRDIEKAFELFLKVKYPNVYEVCSDGMHCDVLSNLLFYSNEDDSKVLTETKCYKIFAEFIANRHFARKSLERIKGEFEKNWEYIVVNDNSDEGEKQSLKDVAWAIYIASIHEADIVDSSIFEYLDWDEDTDLMEIAENLSDEDADQITILYSLAEYIVGNSMLYEKMKDLLSVDYIFDIVL